MLIRVVALFLCIYQSRCSMVIDSMNQKDRLVSEYCPKTQFCEEGTHVMCMYYNPNQPMGPRCSNPQNISMTPDIADKLLEVSNAVRSRIALGKEMGKDGPLPRGYGIFRLSWDDELAQFAQVLANQCVLTRDLCRATKRFPDPGQATGLVRFTFPDWLPVSNKSHFTTSNLTPSKLNYAMTQTMKTWYSQKAHVTPEMITWYPDFQQNSRSQYGKLYLKMVYGRATHVGCGISAYTQYAYYDNNSPLNYNVVQVVCNYSAKPGAGRPVYTTTPPTQIGYTIRCGCPKGYDEDADCLCFESRNQPVIPHVPTSYCSDDSCKQSVVLLPIFTVEDAPPHELLPSRFSNHSRRIGPSGVYNKYEKYNLNAQTLQPHSLNEFTELLKGSAVARATPSAVQRRLKQRKPPNKPPHYIKSNLPALSHVPRKLPAKQSIFSRAEKFHLPTRKVLMSYRILDKDVKKDVAPRKDFSSVQKLLKSYLNRKRNHVSNTFNGHPRYEYTSNEPVSSKEIHEHVSINNLIKKSKTSNPYKIMNSDSKLSFGNGDLNLTNEIKDFITTHINNDTNKKIMHVLENLEKEVKHLELDSTDKEIFELRIRKIYNTLGGKRHDIQLHPIQIKANDKGHNRDIYDNVLNYELPAINEFINKRTLKKNTFGDHKFNVYDDSGLIKRDQNSIRNTDNNYNVYRDNKHDVNEKNNIYAKIDTNTDDRLSYDRRKYYQDKLDDLQRKLKSDRNIRQSSDHSSRHVIPVRPTKGETQLLPRPSKLNQMDTFYIPDKARFIHGF